ncbi:HpcH/HpaI aldolase/citrate lyase family protein [Velocimicrobium porci]|uniref:HpcH/HpaI aldolase/citrate lyase family protein n=1 Tax=Velocimicrobium porci TaxID=2606634 RepID=A0A6L5XV15_9FIRM|nr:HpcH/HpaI aldolase/citrate lyase family protein [Velocimicrobium porci]MSS62656.1 HpcH/HpaI aldolase/citrate lyase family protein [Velocimicrobium porci]
MKNEILCYSIGALLYCPANNENIVHYLINEKFGTLFSLALCLEDTIRDSCVAEAEQQLIHSLKQLHKESQIKDFFMPHIFIRVREPKQIKKLTLQLGQAISIVKGFIIPKFSLENADSYIQELLETNEHVTQTLYMMPIFESPTIIPLNTRYDILYGLKEKLDSISQYVLNIRVGGNDLCHAFGYRRHSSESIHDIKPIFNILSDIITVFGMDYVVSGPVWEYYNGEGWDTGLRNELNQDRLNGFIGKTVIHPNQIPLVNEAYKVSKADFEDAVSILNWDSNLKGLVSGSAENTRMNEYKTHSNWAKKIIILSHIYGKSEF